MARLLAITLGPTQGVILSESDTKPQPEVLQDAATIARRITAFPDRRRDMGAMLLRQMVWRVRQRVGDGSATTAVLAQAMLHDATKLVVAGANPVLIQEGLRLAAAQALIALEKQAVMPNDEDDLTAVAQAVTGDQGLSIVLGELFALLGPHAHVTIQDYMAPYLERTYLDGGRWSGKLISPYLITAAASQRAVQTETWVALYQGTVKEIEQVEPLIAAVAQSESPNLLLVAEGIEGKALEILVANHTQEKTPFKLVAVSLNIGGERAQTVLSDLSVLTGAAVLGPIIGKPLKAIQLTDLGQAKRAEADKDHFIVVEGGGDKSVLRERITQMQNQLKELPFLDTEFTALQERLARFTGSAAILKIGAHTKAERVVLHQKAEQGIRALAVTLQRGYLIGGGLAYLRSRQAIDYSAAPGEEEKMGMAVVSKALEAPAREIMANAGVSSPAVVLDELLRRPEGTVFDAVSGTFGPAYEMGILDPLQVAYVALETAISGAIMALSVGTLILKSKPELSYEP